MSLRSRSPVFFTGCTNDSKKFCDDVSTPPKADPLSPEDYKNLSDAVNAFSKNSEPPPDLERTHRTEIKRPYLLPSPHPAKEIYQNGFEKTSDAPNFGSLSSYVASFEAEVHPSQKHHKFSSMGDKATSLRNSPPNANFVPYATPDNGKNYKRKFPPPAPSTPGERFYTPPSQGNFYTPPNPQVSEFYIGGSQQQQYFHYAEDFNSFTPPSSTSHARMPFMNPKRKSGPPHINKRRRTSSPGSLPVPLARNENPFFPMSEIMWKVYDNNRQTREEQEHKFCLRRQLHSVLQETFPGCELFIVGSTMNGMGTKNCDMDLCLMLSKYEIDQGDEAITILNRVSRVFSKRCKFLKDKSLIRAKVPILKFRDNIRGIDVDLNINNAVGIRNTQLLNSYSRMDQRVSPLVIFIKLWSRSHGINDAKTNTLSSYSLAMMIIHYLQYVCNPPVVPCLQRLQPDKYSPVSDVRKIKIEEDLPLFVSQNQQTLGELFHGFLCYYANDFDFSDSVISVRTGGIIPREFAINVASPKNKKAHWKCISIEEPFDLTNTARSVFDENIFSYILNVFSESWQVLNQTMEIDRIIKISKLLEPRR